MTLKDTVELLKDYGDVLTSAETKEILKVGKTKLYELLSSGAIPAIRVGTNYRILKADLLIYLTQKK